MNGACEVNAGSGNRSRELKILGGFALAFIGLFFLPVGVPRFVTTLSKKDWNWLNGMRRSTCCCAWCRRYSSRGGISAFVSQASVMRYLGPKANKALAYGVASVSGTILAVCSCMVLPLFGGIWMRGAGLGPATAFLYSGPAINVLAIVMTARILGLELGAARAIGAVAFSVVVGFAMHLVFGREEQAKAARLALHDQQADTAARFQGLLHLYPIEPLANRGFHFVGRNRA